MRIMNKENAKRNQEMYVYMRKNPYCGYADLAKIYNISRQAARIIIQRIVAKEAKNAKQ
jgi:hypothetical protein